MAIEHCLVINHSTTSDMSRSPRAGRGNQPTILDLNSLNVTMATVFFFQFHGGVIPCAALSLSNPRRYSNLLDLFPPLFSRASYVCTTVIPEQIALLGLEEELIARDAEDYVAKAVRLATDKAFRGRVSTRILEQHARLFGDAAASEVATEWESFIARSLEMACQRS